MHMVRDTADTETFAIHIAGHRGKVGVKRGTDDRIENGRAVFRAEDDMRQEIGQGLGHGAARWGGLSAL